MSSNPKSINYRKLALDDGGAGGLATAEGRALTRAKTIDEAVAASTGAAGQAEGDAAKAAVEDSKGGK